MPKYTKEMLDEAVKNSISYAEVLRKLNIAHSGSMQSHIKKRIQKFNINVSHFKGQGWAKSREGKRKLNWKTILVKNRSSLGKREVSVRLRRALLESGRKYVCSLCNLGNIWNNSEITLEVDHINNDPLDNRPINLRFLCPNCHSQQKVIYKKMPK